MHHFSRSLATLTGLAIYASAATAQVGPNLAVYPGLVATVASGTNNTLAGNPDTGGTAIAPRFNGVAYWNDPTNGPTLYLSDSAKHRVFQLVLNTGQVTPFAGNGTVGISGDGGPALSAQLNEPSGLALDAQGNLLIADTTANVVRRVELASKTITRYVGDGTPGTPPYVGEGGPALNVKLSNPVGLAIDGGSNLYIADSTQNRILKVAGGTTTVTTVAGNGGGNFGDGVATAVGLQLPVGVAVSGNDLYISEAIAHTVRLVSGGNITTVAGTLGTPGYTGDGGPAAAALLNTPYGLSIDAGGALYIADDQNHVIRKVATDANRTISTIAGTHAAGYSGDGGSALSAMLNGPSFMTINRTNGNLYFIDSGNAAVRSFYAAGNPVTFPLTAVGATANSSITLNNVGDAPLTITAANFPTNFIATGGTCGTTTPTLAPGQSCTLDLQFIPTSGGPTAGNLNFTTSTSGVGANVFLTMSNGLRFVPVTPCRVVDTRLMGAQYGQFGGGALTAGENRDWDIRNSAVAGCPAAPVPTSATVLAYSLNVTVVPRGPSLQYLTLYPTFVGASARPFVSTLNSFDGRVKGNAAIVPVTGSDSRVSAYVTDATDVIIDINGYYVPAASSTTAQAYYPVPPCRVSDTRQPNGSFGGPVLTGGGSLNPGQAPPAGTARTIPVRSSACAIPAAATAYSLNITAIPRGGPLTYLAVWPSDQTIPFVSTLNSPTGAVVANAAIVPASAADGSITAYATNNADLIVDINGYYAPPGPGGLALYNVTPCRAYDSRGTAGLNGPLAVGVSQQGIAGSACSVPPAAQSYILNATAIPAQQPLSYITNWAHGTAQPLQSTLNAYDGSVSSNLAIVPTIDGSINTYVAAPAGLVLDVFGYFAP